MSTTAGTRCRTRWSSCWSRCAADARLLRRRSVRAHLRTCEGCREYADSVRRRPAAAVFGWPVTAYELLASVFRTAAPAKTAAVAAVVATGIGAADVATMKP